MQTLSPETLELLARIAFLVAAVTDGLALVPMLVPRVGAALFVIFRHIGAKDFSAYRSQRLSGI